MKKILGGVCAAAGFRAAACRAGIKRVFSEKEDLALVVSETPCVAAGVFTTNRVQAAPVQISKKHLRAKGHLGIVVNSGNANACTGEQGMADALAMAAGAAASVGGKPEQFLICSTGRIGVPMPMEKILPALSDLPQKLSRKGSKEVAVAMMTSDTFPKESAYSFAVNGGVAKLGGIAKGAGMINPNMATMLCVITTDLGLSPGLAQKLLRMVVERTFNRITVDGDMSTNDTVLLLANGASGVRLEAGEEEAVAAFEAALERVCADLARMIVRDGEGTNKVIEIDLRGAKTIAQAKKAADAVANSILLKCAWAGNDPNWGRIVDALGYSGAVFDPNRVAISYDDLPLVVNGVLGSASMEKVKAVAAKTDFTIRISLGAGDADYRVLTCDLTEEYVRLNLSE